MAIDVTTPTHLTVSSDTVMVSDMKNMSDYYTESEVRELMQGETTRQNWHGRKKVLRRHAGKMVLPDVWIYEKRMIDLIRARGRAPNRRVQRRDSEARTDA